MDNLRNRSVEQLGVNKIGKNIRKSLLHQPDFGANNGLGNNGNGNSNSSSHSVNSVASVGSGVADAPPRLQQPQPQVYKVSKNEFRNIVQQLTGSPARDPLPKPASNLPKPPSMRLQRIRPPPLAPLNRPLPQMYIPVLPPQQVQMQHQQIQQKHQASGPGPGLVMHKNNHFVRPGQFGQPSPIPTMPVTPVDTVWANTAESPISAYMRYLQNSIVEAPRPQHLPQQQIQQQQPLPSQQPPHPLKPVLPHQQMQQHFRGQFQPQQHPSPGILPNPHAQPFLSPRLMNGAPPLLPSPTSQYLLPSPNGYMNFPTPWSPYPIPSPSVQFPTPLTPNFPFPPMGQFSPIGQFGILGPGPQFPPPRSPGMMIPLSPYGFFPISSPRWREQ